MSEHRVPGPPSVPRCPDCGGGPKMMLHKPGCVGESRTGPPHDRGGYGADKGNRTQPEAYTIWTMTLPFAKDGAPVASNHGATLRDVVVIENATFQRILAEHPELNGAAFRMADLR